MSPPGSDTKEELEAHKALLKGEFGPFFDEALVILFRHDPLDLGMGFNADEYLPELLTILSRVRQADSAQELRRIVYEEFKKWFAEEEEVGTEDKYTAMAQELWNAFQQWLKSGRHQRPGEA